MILTLFAEDISHLSLGLLSSSREVLVPLTPIPCLPENYLAVIDTFLAAHDGSLEQLQGIEVSSREGSSTAIRASYAIANALGFARGIPLYAEDGRGPFPVLLPQYEKEAHITARKKDALYRKT